jgi:hypothetical protein
LCKLIYEIKPFPTDINEWSMFGDKLTYLYHSKNEGRQIYLSGTFADMNAKRISNIYRQILCQMFMNYTKSANV